MTLFALLSVGIPLALGGREAGGFAFPLDDAYIHLAVSRNVAFNGVWGINPGEFSAASSSPGWTVLLAAAFRLLGPHAWVALALNGLALAGVVLLLERTGRPWMSWMPLGLAALPVVAATGMEHTAHTLAALGFAGCVAVRAPWVGLAVMAATVTSFRYEGVFEVGIAALLLARAGERARAAAALAGGAAPLLLVGAAWTAAGAWPIPNSLLMKGALGHGWWANLRENASEGLPLVLLAALVASLLPGADSRHRESGLLWLGTAVLHLGLASVGWYYRYEAYLLTWGVAWAVPRVTGDRARGLPVAALAACATVALGARTFEAFRYLPGRVVYVHDVKVELARALGDAHPTGGVAAHDVGALAWVAPTRVVDTAGLGNDRIADLAVRGELTPAAISRIAAEEHATVAVATRSWLEHDRPPGWVPIAEVGWGLDAERQIEPLILYALDPTAGPTALAWAAAAANTPGARVWTRSLTPPP